MSEAKRFLGTFLAPDGRQYRITEETPAPILLDAIEALHVALDREKQSHARTMRLLQSARGR